MRNVVNTGLPKTGVPAEIAVLSNGMLFTSQFPMKSDGTMETGPIAAQTKLTLANLKQSVEAAGGTVGDIAQVIIYIANASDFAGMNEVYQAFFEAPYPNRATVVAGLLSPGMLVEMVAYASIANAAGQ